MYTPLLPPWRTSRGRYKDRRDRDIGGGAGWGGRREAGYDCGRYDSDLLLLSHGGGNRLETATEAVATLRGEVRLVKFLGRRRGVGQWLMILFIPYWVHPEDVVTLSPPLSVQCHCCVPKKLRSPPLLTFQRAEFSSILLPEDWRSVEGSCVPHRPPT